MQPLKCDDVHHGLQLGPRPSQDGFGTPAMHLPRGTWGRERVAEPVAHLAPLALHHDSPVHDTCSPASKETTQINKIKPKRVIFLAFNQLACMCHAESCGAVLVRTNPPIREPHA